jgi:hypothetical protein
MFRSLIDNLLPCFLIPLRGFVYYFDGKRGFSPHTTTNDDEDEKLGSGCKLASSFYF